MTDVTAMGELLIDFTQNGMTQQGNALFEANPGGAPGNVLAMLRKLDKSAALIGKVGNDFFGMLLKSVLVELKINSDYLYMDTEIPTTLAFVHTREDGDRDFSFYRKPGADMMLSKDDIPKELIQKSKIFHFGSLSMTDTIVRNATKKAVAIAKKNNVLVSFDPNLRTSLWKSLEDAKEQIYFGLSSCDILKISQEELEFLTGEKNIKQAIKMLRKHNEIMLITVTMGRQGSIAYYEDIEVQAQAFLQKNTIDTTGAGDTFTACVLNGVLEIGLNSFTRQSLQETLLFANAAASLITTKKGALRVMPDKEEVKELLSERC